MLSECRPRARPVQVRASHRITVFDVAQCNVASVARISGTSVWTSCGTQVTQDAGGRAGKLRLAIVTAVRHGGAWPRLARTRGLFSRHPFTTQFFVHA